MRLSYSVNYQPASKFAKFGKKQGAKAWINFENILYDADNNILDKVLLTNKYGGRLNKDAVSYSTEHPEDVNDPNTMKIINAYEYLKSTNRYEMPSIQQILGELQAVKNDKISDKDAKEVEQSTDDMYVEFMSKLQDPKIQELLKSIGQFQIATTAYGWKYALDNVMRVYKQNPEATFIQQRQQWFKKFNRTIKPDAKRIIIVIPSHESSDLDFSEIRKTMAETRI